MNDYKKSRGRLLTASSLALAAILTMGAGTGWAAGNTTITDGDATITGPISSSDLVDGVVVIDEASSATDVTFTGAVSDLAGKGTGDLVTNKDGTKVQTVTFDAGASLGDASLASNKQGGDLPTVIVTNGNVEVTTGGYKINKLVLEAGTGLVTDPLFSNLGSYDVTQVGKISVDEISSSSIGNPDGTTLGGIAAGMNSHITIGTDDRGAFAENAILALEKHSDLVWTDTPAALKRDMTAGLAITKQLTVDAATGSVEVDGTITNPHTPAGDGSVSLADKSLLIIDDAAVGRGNAAIRSNDAGSNEVATIADTGAEESYLYIANANVVTGQGTTKVLENFQGGVTGDFANVYYDTRLISNNAAGTGATGAGDRDYTVTNDYNSAGSAKDSVTGIGGYAGGKITRSMASTIDAVYTTGAGQNTESTDAGIKFISRATSYRYLDSGTNDKQIVTTLDGAYGMASLAGVQTSSFSISNTVAGNYNARLSYLRDTAPAAGSEPGSVAVWVNPFYNFSDVDGVSIGRHDAEYEISYGGATIGVDTNVNESVRLGLAVSVGGGDTESKGSTFNKTESDFDFWGIGVYGSYTNGMFGLTGDIGYTGASYDIDQRVTGVNMAKFKADGVDTNAFTIGINGEYRFMTENCLNIIPHLGLRYTNLKTDSYRIKSKGHGTVGRVASDTQNIWTIPLGVTFTGDVDTNSGWTIKPMADLGVIFAAGDLDADSDFRVGNTGIKGKVTADDVVDAVTFNGLVGLKADAGNGFSVGLDYNLKASDNLTSHGVTGMIRYEF